MVAYTREQRWDDPTGMAAQMLNYTIPNALEGCVLGPSGDGTWSETANYW